MMRDAGRFSRTFEIRWADLDANRHLRNTAYLEYATHVRFAYLAENGFPPERFLEENVGPVILREEMRFLREVSAGDALTVDYRMAALSADGKRFQLHHRLWRRDGEIAAEITTDGGWLDLAARRLVAPPADLLSAMRSVERTEDFREL